MDTLNEKIKGIILSFEDNVTELDTAIDNFKFPDLASAIEILIVQEKIALLSYLFIDRQNGQESYSDAIQDKISELITQLKELQK